MPQSIDQTDEEIARRVQSGEVEPFGMLVERYEAKMMRYAKKFLFSYNDIEDLIQNIFLKAYVNIQSFDPSRKFSSWLYRIAHNEFINTIKKKGKEPLPFFDPDAIFPHPVAKEDIEKDINNKELRQTLDQCLDKLDPKYREVLVLYYFEEFNYREIADILHIPMATVGIRLKRGKETMRSLYKKL